MAEVIGKSGHMVVLCYDSTCAMKAREENRGGDSYLWIKAAISSLCV